MEANRKNLTEITDAIENRIQSAEGICWEEIAAALRQIPEELDKGLHGLVCLYAAFYMVTNGRQGECLFYINESIRCMMGTPQEKHIARSYNILGIITHEQNNLILAVEHYNKGVFYAKKYDMLMTHSMIVSNMADAYHRVEAYERAIYYFEQCVREYEALGKKTANEEESFRKILSGYGYCLVSAGRLEEAALLADKLESLIKKDNIVGSAKMSAYTFFAYLNHRKGDWRAADRCLETAMDNLQKMVHIYVEYDNIRNLISYLIHTKRYDCLEAVLDCIEPQMAIQNNEGILVQLLMYRMHYCSSEMTPEEFRRNADAFFHIKEKYEYNENTQALKMLELRNRLMETEREHKELREINSKLQYQMEHDGLSGLYSKQHLNRHAERVFEESVHNNLPLGVLFVDIDCFKQLNDHYGHQKGDECIRTIAKVIKDCVKEDFAARYGGDEFVIIMQGRSYEYLEGKAHALVKLVQSMEIPNRHSEVSQYVTVTVGAAYGYPRRPNKMWDYMLAADMTLFEQKKTRKGCARLRML